MGEGVEATRDEPLNTCCAALKKKHSKLEVRCSKLEEIKNQFRILTEKIREKYDVIEKENESLKQDMVELKVQADKWKREMEQESGIRVDLEDEVSALKEEIQLLKQNGNSASQEADEKLQERLSVAEKEINRLKELLDKERRKASLEKKNAELEKKKADEAMKKVEMEKNKASGAQKVANAERKKAEESRLIWEKLKTEADALKSMLDLEKSKSEAAEKKVEAERQKVNEAIKKVEIGKSKASEAQKLANAERKKSEENRLMWEKLKTEIDSVKSMLALERSKSEAAEKKVEAERQKAIKERKRADLAVAKVEEQRELAQTNLKKATVEKDRADDLNRKLEEARNRSEKLEEELRDHLCSVKLVEAHADGPNTGRNAELTSNVCMEMVKNDALLPPWMKKMLLENEQDITREKKRADLETKNAKKQKKVAEANKKMAEEEKHRADQLFRELETYKRLEELHKERQESVPYRMHADNSLVRCNNVISETDSVKLLKKQLKLEKMLVKSAKEATKVESIRNNMLHQELFHVKQDFLRLQQRLDMLDSSFLHGGEGTHLVKKIGDHSTREKNCSDVCYRQLASGIDSRLDPPHRGSNRKMLPSSAINSCSASFSDRDLVGSQERGAFSVTTSAKLGEDTSNLKPTISRLSDKTRIRYKEHSVDKAISVGSPIKGNDNKRRVGYQEKNRILDAVESIENLYSKGEKLQQRVSEKLSQLHEILNCKKDEPAEEHPQEQSCREHSRPLKRRKTSFDGSIVIHPLHDSGEPKSVLDMDVDQSDAYMRASPLGSDVMRSDQCFQDGANNILVNNGCISQDFVEMASYDYMKLLDLDNAADEESYRRAIANPLSPTLAEIEFHGNEKFEVHNPEMLVDKVSQEVLSNVKDNLATTSSSDILDMEKNHTNLVPGDLVSLQLQAKEGSIQLNGIKNFEPASDAHFHQIQVSGEKLGMSDLSGSGNEGTYLSCKSWIANTPGGLLKYFVVSSDNKDTESILRIVQTIDSCMPQCSLLQSAEILRSLLPTLLKAKDLSTKEKACVFFSIMLNRISKVGLKSDDVVQSLDSLTLHIHSALSDLVLRRIFMESCDLFELLALIEDFILQRTVLLYNDVSAESQVLHTPKINLVLNGKAIVLSEVAAPAHLLVAAGSLLASYCLAVDHIGVLCEMSCNIFTMHKFDPAVVLAVLHSFAHVCGSKYFALEQYTVQMTVVKSMVMFLEKQTLSTNHSMDETSSKFWLCSSKCPFSEGAVSMEDVALMLLEKLQKYGVSVSWPQDSLELVNSVVPTVSGLREVAPSSATSDENLCDFIDILSLLEIQASFMSWDWTFDNIISQICEWLESRPTEGFSAAIVVFLGQLGRLGVSASGYEDTRVEKLRGWLSAFLCESKFSKLSIPVHFAIVTSLLALAPIKFEEIVEDKAEGRAIMNKSIPADFIKEWFSQLSSEQQSFFRLHQEVSS